jgi:type VI secretion system protein ImpM
MPDPRPVTGLYGKIPAHGDFVRRGLPSSFIAPWDAWLQQGMAAAREALGPRWTAAWDGAPPWRFALPAGACGPEPVAGVILPSEDMVGRRFPLTLAALLPAGAPMPEPGWFAALEAAARAGRAGRADADALAAAIPRPGEDPGEVAPPLPAPGAAAADPAPGLSASALDTPLPADTLDVLALFAEGGGAVASAAGPEAAEEDGAGPDPSEEVLALLAGGAAMGAPPSASAGEDGADDVLVWLAGTGAAQPLAAMPPGCDGPAGERADGGADGQLALLIGEAAGAGEAAPGAVAGVAGAEDPPPLAVPPAAEPPAAPPGGGWWTAGAARLPPTAWALPALPPAEAFIRLLEADA